MKIELTSNQSSLPTIQAKVLPTSLLSQVGLFIVLLACSMAVFLFGTNYVSLFPTNGNTAYAAGTTAIFLAAALLFKRSDKFNRYWLVAYAFFIASSVNLISDLFAGYNTDFVRLFGWTADQNRVMALAKIYETLLVIIPIIVLTLVSGADLGSIFLKIGNQNYKWGFGIGGLVLADFFTSALIFFGPGYELAKLGPVIGWALLFSMFNALSEELWIRGLFMKKMYPLIGIAGTVLLTSVTFGLLHMTSVVYLPAFAVPIFLVNTFAMGLACGILMYKTDSIWGAYMIHMAADIFLFVATLAAR
jgi:membrane protease YdiL (CAAX protease family)